MGVDISIVIPVHNKEKYLRGCLESVFNSDFENYELICVDDKSTDSSYEILKEYVSCKQKIRLYQNDINYGVAHTRNVGIDKAKGKYILFLDADDQLDKNALNKFFLQMEDKRSEVCFIKFAENEGAISKGIKKSYQNFYTGIQTLKMFVENDEDFLYACGAIYKRDFIQKNKILFEDLKIGEGGLFILQALLKASRVVISDYKGYVYNINESSTSNNVNAMKEASKGHLTQMLYIFNRVAEGSDNKEILALFLDWYIKKNIGGITNLNEIEALEVVDEKYSLYDKLIVGLLNGTYHFYNIKLNNEMESLIKKHRKVYLYGAGQNALSVIRYCNQIDVEICGIFVTSLKNNPEYLYGYKIREFNMDSTLNLDIPFVITTQKKYFDVIKKLLSNAGVKNIATIIK